MKKLVAILLILVLCLSAVSCSGGNSSDADTDLLEKFDSMEYSAYVNIFFNGLGSDYENKTYTKEGIFAVVQDEFNNTSRYYVWGYADQTKCCDYQWEIVFDENAEIPVPGSFVKFTGTFVADENALDGYWFTDVSLEVTKEKAASAYDYDLTNLSPTLVRVQLINMQNFPDVFDAKTVSIYGRVYDDSTIQHPYYDDTWYLECRGGLDGGIGKYVTVSGTFTTDGEDSYLQIN